MLFFYTTNADKKGVLTFPGLLDIALQFRTLVMKKGKSLELVFKNVRAEYKSTAINLTAQFGL